MDHLTKIDVEWVIVACLMISWMVQMLLAWALFSSGKSLSELLSKAESEGREAAEALSRQVELLQQSQTKSLEKLCALLGQRPVGGLPSPPESGSRRLGVDKKHQVIGLAKRGWDAGDISRRLKLHQGETELMLKLRSYVSDQDTSNGKEALF